ncbi:endonuclease domain-containing protein [Henriciella mobilis]|uniref:endonuclease domain-containing protein n=1 Tax=Henriciella mobilis TaxID=2305467 RepID=UPI0011C38E45|nr:DUF559 domain-containing protein [Henriciella mobilis]
MGLYKGKMFCFCSLMASRSQILRARQLRRDMTPAERLLWSILRTERFKPFHLRRQAPVDRWIVDFLSHRAQLVIEIDGETHSHEQDARRDRALKALGFDTLRFFNGDVWQNASGVADRIYDELSWRYSPHPDPPRERGGDAYG